MRRPGNVVGARRTARRAGHGSWAEAEYRAVFEHAAIGIAVVDVTGHPVRVNPALVQILGYTPEELAAMSFADFTHPDDVQADWALFQELLAGARDAYQMEKRYIRKDGAMIWGHLSVSVIKDASGAAAYAIGMLKDITQRKRAEHEAQRTTELLRRSSDERRDLLSRLVAVQDEERRRIADDIHDDPIQQLTAASVRLGHLKRLVDDAEAGRLVDEMEATTSAAIARLRALQFDLRPRSLDEPGGLREAVWLRLRELREASGADVELVEDVHRAISPETGATAYRILVEALSNVQKHSRARHLTVTLATAAEGVSATVADNGCGFDPDAGVRARHIGLAAMRERAEAAGGAWRVESAPGVGTTIHLWLPDASGSDAS